MPNVFIPKKDTKTLKNPKLNIHEIYVCATPSKVPNLTKYNLHYSTTLNNPKLNIHEKYVCATPLKVPNLTKLNLHYSTT